ncbi:14728_t:CDS:2 [Gigaspora margarita]|uniref:14728_t:CDS:1 n=1 Tax=Gigaspora margarita TaxID=4874 RepID=A0ABM8W791_GIGMA|nr:14728_t:CDS:2 [Gigaspora margarita]
MEYQIIYPSNASYTTNQKNYAKLQNINSEDKTIYLLSIAYNIKQLIHLNDKFFEVNNSNLQFLKDNTKKKQETIEQIDDSISKYTKQINNDIDSIKLFPDPENNPSKQYRSKLYNIVKPENLL